MHGSTSPSKKGLPPSAAGRKSQQVWLFQRKAVSSRATADSTAASAGSIPVARNRRNVKRVDNQSGAPGRRQEPSDSWQARMRAARPSRETRARSAVIVEVEASMTSRITCQLIAGSESSSQSIVFMRRYYLALAKGSMHSPRVLQGRIWSKGERSPATPLLGARSASDTASWDSG